MTILKVAMLAFQLNRQAMTIPTRHVMNFVILKTMKKSRKEIRMIILLHIKSEVEVKLFPN